MRGTSTIVLLFLSTAFMSVAWCGHPLSDEPPALVKLGLFSANLVNWSIAFDQDLLRPVDRLGHVANGVGSVFSR